ncbi:MAG: hypothetical protein A3D31_04105 [Candidatus Fluviicola riflensis]|nr:MAG: hypothetical protein CHH17_10925 [Candidatus Fluviicola riflensis]OGS79160.1 MAG: hypothetical protein A3D31_04105 [Candidatus Fluviicola riflensis]OGS86592.1 MAG: hypothetical protein A2724_03565 [Fluviicola sp. RIFCSPHIGHO2_01_FULL_43_53]OGS88934.1 MAG: hypothetical protein A3E30_01095 [Fluviicola sp. RIFCSPHIGHO2_12_FULL_43_24]
MKQLLVAALVLLSTTGYSQELNCQVTIINDSRMEITTVEKEIFEQMKQTIYELMNNTKWTKDKFTVEERINCQIQLQINSIPTPGTYEGSLQIQSSRPVFNGSYNTTLFNFQDDDIAFTYARNAVLIYAPNQFRDNLTSVLAFYAYYIIGMDYDSFSLKGGTPYFTEAQQIVSNAQAAGGKGWKSNEQGKRNRYWLVDNIQQQLFEPLRECMYEYHRKGMDILFENKETGRKNVYTALNKLSKVSSTRPNSVNVLNFAQAKLRELKELYQDATPAEKTEVVTVLKRIDPANSSKYEEILN